MRNVQASKDDPNVIRNAARFFQSTDQRAAERLLQQGAALQPDAEDWYDELGRLYLNWGPDLSTKEAGANALAAFEKALALTRPGPDKDRNFADLADAALDAELLDKAREYAINAISQKDHPLGLHKGNNVLGWVELKQGRLAEAAQYLIASGKVGSAPVLATFGPRFGLANELLKLGERNAVLAYLESCTTFWKSGQAQLKNWIDAIKNGGTPDLLQR